MFNIKLITTVNSFRNKISLIVLALLFLNACSGGHRLAPVRNLSIEAESQKIWKRGDYKVQKSDTLYSIAFRFGIDFKQLAQINNIKHPYTIYPEQILKLRYKQLSEKRTSTPPKKEKNVEKQVVTNATKSKNVAKQQNKKVVKTAQSAKNKGVQSGHNFDKKKKVTVWLWPVKNNDRKNKFSWVRDQQGINIKGRLGDSVRASADGVVVYSGNGLVGYGNLIIIKHSQNYLSAYAHNDKLQVSEKEVVKAGQKIATMGKNDTGQVQLHFEIRYQGRPVNPLKHLP